VLSFYFYCLYAYVYSYAYAYAGQLNSLKHIKALLVLHDRGERGIWSNNDTKHADAGQLNSLALLRALLVPHDCGSQVVIWMMSSNVIVVI
jgi:hypothetical protein